MAVCGISGSNSNAYSQVNTDPQVKSLKAKIDDWQNCPTTDASTKKTIVTRLQGQLDAVTSRIEASQKATDSPKNVPPQQGQLDIRA